MDTQNYELPVAVIIGRCMSKLQQGRVGTFFWGHSVGTHLR